MYELRSRYITGFMWMGFSYGTNAIKIQVEQNWTTAHFASANQKYDDEWSSQKVAKCQKLNFEVVKSEITLV